MKNKKGFTLVELLAVIVILSLLFVILTPNVIKTMKSSKRKACDQASREIINLAKAYFEVEPNNTENYIARLREEYYGGISTKCVKEGWPSCRCVSVGQLMDKGYVDINATKPVYGDNPTVEHSWSEEEKCRARVCNYDPGKNSEGKNSVRYTSGEYRYVPKGNTGCEKYDKK